MRILSAILFILLFAQLSFAGPYADLPTGIQTGDTVNVNRGHSIYSVEAGVLVSSGSFYKVDQGDGYEDYAGVFYVGPDEPQDMQTFDIWIDSDALTTPIPTLFQKCFVIKNPEDADDFPIEKFPFAITISEVSVYPIAGTSITGFLDECTAGGGVCSSLSPVKADPSAFTSNGNTVTSSLTNGTIAADNWIHWHTTSVSGSVVSVSVCFEYSRD